MYESKNLVMMVEDNPDILRLNAKWLEDAGFATASARSLAEAKTVLDSRSPDVIILDVVLPDGDGVDFLPEVRRYSSAPVLFLSSKDKPEERMLALAAGGNDYITKPYDIAELCLRVKNFVSLCQRTENLKENVDCGPIKLDLLSRRAFINGVDMCLSGKEFSLLLLFITNEEKAMSAEQLSEKVWGCPSIEGIGLGAVKTAVSRLRMKLDDTEFMIITRRGVGYSFIKQ